MPSTADWMRDKASKYIPRETGVGLADQVNFIMKVAASPCAPFLSVYVETLFSASLEAFIMFRELDEGDFLRTLFRPKGKKRGAHLRGGRNKSEWTRREALSLQNQRHYTSGVRSLWTFDTFTQKILFWVMIIDIASDFIYNWHALALSSADCGPGSAALTAFPGIILTAGGWNTSRFPHVSYDSLAVSTAGNGFVFNTKAGFASAAISIENQSGLHGVLVDLRITTGTGTQFKQSFDSKNLGAGDFGDLVVQLDIPKGNACVIGIRTAGLGVCNIQNGDAYAASSE